MNRYRILITGVGSLVGKGVLDALEGRRENLYIIGAGFGEVMPAMARCDEFVRTPPSDHPDFAQSLQRAVDMVGPDLVIPGRDFDVPVVAALDAVSTTGERAEVGTDKWATYEFARERGLAIVPTALPETADFGPPAVSKPRVGGGSLGVRLLLDDRAFALAKKLPNTVMQPLVGPLPEVDPIGLPLFWQAPLAREGGVQGVIGPDGRVGIATGFETHHDCGRVSDQWLVDDPQLLGVGRSYLAAMARAGWRGPLNVACIWDGEWLCLELNPRFTGGTAARTAMGFDEVGWTVNAWAGREVVPPVQPRGDVVVQQVHPYPMWRDGRGIPMRDATSLKP